MNKDVFHKLFVLWFPVNNCQAIEIRQACYLKASTVIVSAHFH